jgi:hypothetical protein
MRNAVEKKRWLALAVYVNWLVEKKRLSWAVTLKN